MVNRLKVSIYVALVVMAGGIGAILLPRMLSGRALSQVDTNLRIAMAMAESRLSLISSEAAAMAETAARLPSIVQIAGSDQGELGVAARAAVATFQSSSGAWEHALLLGVHDRGVFRPERASTLGMAPLGELLASTARDGQRRVVQMLLDGRLCEVGIAQVVPGVSIALGVPLTASAFGPIRGVTGAEITIQLPGAIARNGVLRKSLAESIAAAGRAAVSRPVSVGRLPRLSIGVGPRLPLLLVRAPAFRVQSLALNEVPGALVVMALPTASGLGPVLVVQWALLLGAGAALLLGLITLLSMGRGSREAATIKVPKPPSSPIAAEAEAPSRDLRAAEPIFGPLGASDEEAVAPTELLAEREVPRSAPSEGDEQSLLKRSSEDPFAVRPASSVSQPTPSSESEPQAKSLFEEQLEGAMSRGMVPESAGSLTASESSESSSTAASSLTGAPLTPPAPVGPPREVAQEKSSAADEGVGRSIAAAIEAPGVPSEGLDDEAHWRAVYQDFVKMREQCGEPQSLSFERFRQKLASNKEQIVAKYNCRTVRFQVYVKEGKAALKASPVR